MEEGRRADKKEEKTDQTERGEGEMGRRKGKAGKRNEGDGRRRGKDRMGKREAEKIRELSACRSTCVRLTVYLLTAPPGLSTTRMFQCPPLLPDFTLSPISFLPFTPPVVRLARGTIISNYIYIRINAMKMYTQFM